MSFTLCMLDFHLSGHRFFLPLFVFFDTSFMVFVLLNAAEANLLMVLILNQRFLIYKMSIRILEGQK